jgi:hypothetical protein
VAVRTGNAARKQAGVLTVQRHGAKLSGTFELENHDPSTVTGSIQGAKVSIKIEVHGTPFTLVGTVDGDSMSGATEPALATWKAIRKQVSLRESGHAVRTFVIAFLRRQDAL